MSVYARWLTHGDCGSVGVCSLFQMPTKRAPETGDVDLNLPQDDNRLSK
jgi:hypothetical protein